MPKKKLTKAQVKSKLKQIDNKLYDLALDKLGHPDSRVTISVPKLLELAKTMHNAFKRVK
jgi:hypothetical protein